MLFRELHLLALVVGRKNEILSKDTISVVANSAPKYNFQFYVSKKYNYFHENSKKKIQKKRKRKSK